MHKIRYSLSVAMVVWLILAGRGLAGERTKPNLYLLSVGIDKYQAPTPSLKGCVNDARGMAKVLQDQQGKTFAQVEAVVLADAQATQRGIADALTLLEKKGRPGDWHVLVLSGHGGISADKWAFLGQDGGNIADETIMGLADRLASNGRKVLIVIDACHAGVLRFAADEVLNRHRDPAKGGIILMISSMPDQVSTALGSFSAFARAVEDGLRGLADYDDDGVVTLREQQRFTYKRVYELLAANRAFPGFTVRNQDSVIDASLSMPGSVGLVRAKRAPTTPRQPDGPKIDASPLPGQTWTLTTTDAPPTSFEMKLERSGAYRVTLKAGTRPTMMSSGSYKVTAKALYLVHHQGFDRLEVISATPTEFRFRFQDREHTLRADRPQAMVLDVSGRLLQEDERDRVRAGSPHKVYPVKLEAGVTYVMDMESADVDAYLRLEDAGGTQVAADDDGGGNRNARIRYVPTRSGDFRVVATTYQGGSGVFSLRVAKVDGPRVADAAPAAAHALVNLNQRLTDTDPKDRVRTESFVRAFKMDLKAGVKYVIDLVSEDFDPYLRLEDSDGKPLAQDDDGGEGLNARIEFTPARDGSYRILATSYRKATGRFTLTVRAPGVNPVAGGGGVGGVGGVGGAPLVLKDGAAKVVDRLAADDPKDTARTGSHRKAYLVKLEQGKEYTLLLKSTDFDAYLRLEDAGGKELTRDDDSGGGRNARIVFVAPASATYRIVATTFLERATGSFELSINLSSR